MLAFVVSQIFLIIAERTLDMQLRTHIKHQAVSLSQMALSNNPREEKVLREMLASCETIVSDV